MVTSQCNVKIIERHCCLGNPVNVLTTETNSEVEMKIGPYKETIGKGMVNRKYKEARTRHQLGKQQSSEGIKIWENTTRIYMYLV